MRLIGTYNLAGAVTFTSLGLAVAAMALSWHGQLAWAVIALVWAGICDLLDGWVARRRPATGAERAFGLQIDSIVDMAAFGIAPWVILLHAGRDSGPELALYLLYSAAAAMRLAHFNSTRCGSHGPASHYEGVPVTYAALVFPVTLLAADRVAVAGLLPPLAALGLAVAFVLPVPVPKPRGRAYGAFAALAVVLSGLWWLRT